jgi:hypothetical protein
MQRAVKVILTSREADEENCFRSSSALRYGDARLVMVASRHLPQPPEKTAVSVSFISHACLCCLLDPLMPAYQTRWPQVAAKSKLQMFLGRVKLACSLFNVKL